MIVRPGSSLAAVLVAAGLLASCGGDEDPNAVEVLENTVPAAPEVTSGTVTASSSTTTAPVVATTPPTAPPAPVQAASVRLPNVVGLDLQHAQDTLQAAGFYVLSSHDAAGLNRNQVLDRNWQVCDQTPRGGTMASPDTAVDLGAVKDEESCP